VKMAQSSINLTKWYKVLALSTLYSFVDWMKFTFIKYDMCRNQKMARGFLSEPTHKIFPENLTQIFMNANAMGDSCNQQKKISKILTQKIFFLGMTTKPRPCTVNQLTDNSTSN